MTTTTLLPHTGLEEGVPSPARGIECLDEPAGFIDCAVCGLTHAQGTGDDPGCPAPAFPVER